MQKIRVFESVLVLFASLCILSPAKAADSIRVVVFGDSLTSGYQLDQEQGFTRVLENTLKEAGFDAKVINMSIAGETTNGGVQRASGVLKQEPDIIILELGANDALRGVDPEKTTFPNIRKMVDIFKRSGAAVILVGAKAPPNWGADYVKKFDNGYASVAKDMDVTLYPFILQGIATDPRYNLADGLHPNPEGVRIMVKNFYPTLYPLMRWAMENQYRKQYYKQ